MIRLLLVLILLPVVVIDALGAEPTARPNIVLFVADDHGLELGCYGNKVIQTPHMDALAREGTICKRAFCTAASCSPSRSVLLTGLQNHANGQFGLEHAYHHFQSYPTLRTLPVILGEHGYRTARIGKFHVAPEETYHFAQSLPGNPRNGFQMANQCQALLAEKSAAPFFLYFCTTDPHRSDTFRGDKPGRPDAFGNDQPHAGINEISYDPKDVIVPSYLPDLPSVRAELAEYYQSVSRVDQGLGRLVALLKESGHYDDTVIIYTSDNGCAMPGSKTTLYEPGIHLPLIIKPAQGEAHVPVTDAMISWVDMTPTILDFANVTTVMAPKLFADNRQPDAKKPNGQPVAGKPVPYQFHGRSFRTDLNLAHDDSRKEVFASHTFHEVTMYYPMRVIRTERYKLIVNLAHQLPFPFAQDLFASATWQANLTRGPDALFGKRKIQDFIQRPRLELYDLETDPDEVVNLAPKPEHAPLLQDLTNRLTAWQKATQDPWVLKSEHE
jgi:N-sulfoglucosamine sulfohydrolase